MAISIYFNICNKNTVDAFVKWDPFFYLATLPFYAFSCSGWMHCEHEQHCSFLDLMFLKRRNMLNVDMRGHKLLSFHFSGQRQVEDNTKIFLNLFQKRWLKQRYEITLWRKISTSMRFFICSDNYFTVLASFWMVLCTCSTELVMGFPASPDWKSHFSTLFTAYARARQTILPN